jgi:soluble lytic murein transglycosylase-like protein
MLLIGATQPIYADLSPTSLRLLKQAAAEYKLDYRLLVAIARVESGGKPNAVNKRTRDYGLMQINHRTAKAYGYKATDMLDKRKSIAVAAKLLSILQKKFGHEPAWACRYNAGWHRNVPNWSVCKNYMAKLQKAGYSVIVERHIANN